MADGATSLNTPRPRVLFAMEQHLGHRTYAENLRSHVDDERFEATWLPIDYEHPESLTRWPIPESIKSAVGCHRAVSRGVAATEADVHVFNTQVPAVLGGRAARSRPFIVITDITPIQYDRLAEEYEHRADRPGPAAWLKHRLNTRTLTKAAWCVGWSTWVCESFVDDYGIPRDRTRVIPPGVDTSRWRPGPERDDGVFRILFVGGDFARKGGEQLIDAFAQLPGDAELVLVTKSAVPRTERIRVIDDLEPNDPRLIELYRTSDVFALPSRAEAFGIAAVEAAASGLPVVATDVGGLTDIVDDGVTGFTVPVGDVDCITSSLLELRDPDLRSRMARAARERAQERFDAAANAGRLLDLVERAATGRSAG